MNERTWDVVGVGENSVDHVLLLAERPHMAPGAKVAITSQHRTAGGQVATALCACAVLGLRTAYVGAFGDDEDGAFARAELEHRGVETSAAHTRLARTRQAVILVDPEGERLVLWSRDPALQLDPAQVPADLLAQTRLVHVDAVDIDAAIYAARLARDAGAIVTCDIDGIDPRAEELLEAVTLPILAEELPAALTGEANLERAVRALARRHAGPICVTRGAQGALLFQEGRFYRSPVWQVDAVDTTGAGDVFRGAFITALLAGDSPDAILRFATAAAALSCTRVGAFAGVPTREEIDALLLEEQAPQRGHE
jgi:sulfofructose kinase